MYTLVDHDSAADRLSSLLSADYELDDFMDSLAQLAARELTSELPVLVGIILERDKNITIVGSSDAEAKKLDEVQAGFDEGPCLEAQETHTLIKVADVRLETRWPDYMTTVREHDLRSVLAIPLDVDDATKASMNFYTTAVEAFDDQLTASAMEYASLVSKAMRVAVRIARHAEAANHRQRAMESRTVIDLAVGITMAQMKCSQQEAFNVLKTASSHRNVKLRTLAEELVASLGQPAPATVFDD